MARHGKASIRNQSVNPLKYMNRTIIASRYDHWLRASEKTLNILIRIVVYSSAFYFFSFVSADTDLWGHIKFGQDLWAAWAFQRVDIYSYTASGHEWINHEWLSELIMYFTYRFFGSAGLLIGKTLVGFSIVYMLSKICFYRTCEPLVYGIIFVLAVFVMSPGFMIRPQLVTFLFTAYFLYTFHLYLERGKDRLWSLPVVMVAWVNCHGGFLIGAGLFPVIVAGDYISCLLREKDPGYLKRMVLWCTLTEIAVLINPYGYHLLAFLMTSLSAPRQIGEWFPVTVFDASYLRFKLLAALFLCSFLVRNPQRRYWEVSIIGVAMIYAFMHQRHTPIFAILTAPYLTENLSILVQKRRVVTRIRTLSSQIVLICFLFLLFSYQTAFAGYKYIEARWNIIVNPDEYPVAAVRFIKQNGIKGKILTPFEWGEYAIWKLYPDSQVSMDGRFRTVYPEEVIRGHFWATRDIRKLTALLEKYPADIILGRQNPLYQQMMTAENEWIYVYSDPTSMVFLRDNRVNREVLKKFRKNALTYSSEKISPFFP